MSSPDTCQLSPSTRWTLQVWARRSRWDRCTSQILSFMSFSLIGSFLVPPFAGTDIKISCVDVVLPQVTPLWRSPSLLENDAATKQAVLLLTNIHKAPESATAGGWHRQHDIFSSDNQVRAIEHGDLTGTMRLTNPFVYFIQVRDESPERTCRGNNVCLFIVSCPRLRG